MTVSSRRWRGYHQHEWVSSQSECNILTYYLQRHPLSSSGGCCKEFDNKMYMTHSDWLDAHSCWKYWILIPRSSLGVQSSLNHQNQFWSILIWLQMVIKWYMHINVPISLPQIGWCHLTKCHGRPRTRPFRSMLYEDWNHQYQNSWKS